MKRSKTIAKTIGAAMFCILAGCASGRHSPNSPLTSESARLDELTAKAIAIESAGKNVTTIYTIPDADDFFLNSIILLATKTGFFSTHAKGVSDIVKANNVPSVTVIGESDAITAAVIESAIKLLKGVQSSTVIYFAGDRDYVNRLRALADETGVKLEAVVYP